MRRFIWKSIFTTLFATIILCAILVAACVSFFPPTVMEFAYNVGWEATAVKYAEKSYNRFGDAYYLAYAMELSVEEGWDESTEKYAELLIAHDKFESFCESKDAKSFYIGADGNRTDEKLQSTYKQHVYVSLCTAKYRLDKKDEAVSTAYNSLDGKFPPNNPLAAVLLYALKAQDSETTQKISVLLDTFETASLETADANYLAAMKGLIAAV